MPEDILEPLDPWRAVRNGHAFAGEIALCHLPRLAAAVIGCDDDPRSRVVYQLRFERDRDGRALVIGQIRSALRLTCQRCLGEVEIEVDAPLRLCLIKSDQMASDLPDDLDPLAVADQLDVMALIEDEILLAIPTVPRHEDGLCQPLEPFGGCVHPHSPGQVSNETGQDRSREEPHPFAVLAGIRCGPGD